MKGRGLPPWGYAGPPPWHRDEWRGEWHARRRALFLRFAAAFGILALLVFGWMAVLALLLTRLFGGAGPSAVLVWIGGSALALVLPVLILVVAGRVFRRVAAPLADVMAAADAAAQGNLSTRVPVHGPGEFARLAKSFNHMLSELEDADRRRRDLTADVAHELRTPLHIIQGNLEGILDGVYSADEQHIAATLAETRALARLVDDLRTLALAEAGQLPLAKETVDVRELLDDAGTSFSGQAEAAGIVLLTDTEGASGALTVTGDTGRLDQVLGNLLANAVRHTPPGGQITLQARPLPPAEGGHVRITVADTGRGIPAEDLPHIFDRFWRAGEDAAGNHSGLGLAIARQLVEAQGGHISVASQPGQGTTFTIDL